MHYQVLKILTIALDHHNPQHLNADMSIRVYKDCVVTEITPTSIQLQKEHNCKVIYTEDGVDVYPSTDDTDINYIGDRTVINLPILSIDGAMFPKLAQKANITLNCTDSSTKFVQVDFGSFNWVEKSTY